MSKTPARGLMKPDPIFAAIKDAHLKQKIWNRLYDDLDRAEYHAEKKHGRRPWSLIAWRCYSAIGGFEIDNARERFLRERVAPRRQIEKEYRAAKARGRAGERAQIAWDKRAGITVQRRECDRAIAADNRLHKRMAKTRPTTPAGAAALLSYVKTSMEGGKTEWHKIALDTIITTLPNWTLQAK